MLTNITNSSTFINYGNSIVNKFLEGSAKASDGTVMMSSNNGLPFSAGVFTIEFWVKLVSYKTEMGLFSTGSGTIDTGSIHILVSNNGTLTFKLINISSMTINISSAIPLNTWTHICLTRSAPRTFNIFINGVFRQFITAGFNASWNTNLTKTIWTIGGLTGVNNSQLSAGSKMTGLRISNNVRYSTTTSFIPSNEKITNSNDNNYIVAANMSSFDFTSNRLNLYKVTYQLSFTGNKIVFDSDFPYVSS